MATSETIASNASGEPVTETPSPLGPLLHSLSNKILPIVVFSELALRRCGDSQLKPQLEKIHGAAEEARDLLLEIRTLQNKEGS